MGGSPADRLPGPRPPLLPPRPPRNRPRRAHPASAGGTYRRHGRQRPAPHRTAEDAGAPAGGSVGVAGRGSGDRAWGGAHRSEGRIVAVGPRRLGPAAARMHWPRSMPRRSPSRIGQRAHASRADGSRRYPPDPDFAAWIRRVRTLKAERSADTFLEAARAGLAECYAAGVTTIADTGDSGAVIRAMAEAGGLRDRLSGGVRAAPGSGAESLAGLQARVAERAALPPAGADRRVAPCAIHGERAALPAVARWARRSGCRSRCT